MAVGDPEILKDGVVLMIHVFSKIVLWEKNKNPALELRIASRTLDTLLFQGHCPI
jgi:hypothetical protein